MHPNVKVKINPIPLIQTDDPMPEHVLKLLHFIYGSRGTDGIVLTRMFLLNERGYTLDDVKALATWVGQLNNHCICLATQGEATYVVVIRFGMFNIPGVGNLIVSADALHRGLVVGGCSQLQDIELEVITEYNALHPELYASGAEHV